MKDWFKRWKRLPFWCKFGLHKWKTFTMDGRPVGEWFVIGRRYQDECQRDHCGCCREYTFYIDRT